MSKFNYKTILFYLFLLVFTIVESKGGGDFKIFLDASKDLFNGKNIYTQVYNEYYHYYYDLFFAIIIYPLTFIPLFFAKFIWIIFNIFLISQTWKLLINWLPVDLLSSKMLSVFKIIIWLFMLRFMRDNLHLCQMTITILFLSLKGLDLIQNKKNMGGAFLIALGISIKILPVVLIPYLIFRSYFKESLMIVMLFIFLQIIPILFVDFNQVILLLQERWHSLNPNNENHILDTSERSFHSLTTLLSTLLVEKCGDTYALTLKRNIADLSLSNLKLVILIVRLFLIFFTIYFLGMSIFKKQLNKLNILYELSYIFLLIPLIFPHQQHYAFYFLFPAIVYLTFYWTFYFDRIENKVKTRKLYLIIGIAFIFYFLTNCHLILGTFNEYYDHYKILTYGAILFIPSLAYSHPKKLNLQNSI
jgi:hypothetical protein